MCCTYGLNSAYLIFGIILLILGTTAIILDSGNIFKYGYTFIGILFLGSYLFENSKQYLSIENGTISKNHLVPKTIKLNEIMSIKKFAGDYILKTKTTELTISTELIEKSSLAKLDAVLENLNLETK